MNAAFPDLGCKQGAKAVPPVPHRLITNVDATFEQNVFDLAQRLVEPLGPLAVHDQAFRFKHCVQHQVAVARILFTERLESITQRLIITRLRLISG